MNKEEGFEEENLFSDGFWIGCGSKEKCDMLDDKALGEEEWTPCYPVDLGHPAELTEEQQAHAEALIQALDKFFDENPEDAGVAPLLRITQNWEVQVSRGGHMNFTDWVRPIIVVMRHEESGYFVDYDYVTQCVPFIEKELEEMLEHSDAETDEIPSIHQQNLDRTTTLEMELVGLLSSLDPSYGYENILIAVDRVMPEVYPIPAHLDHDDYGGLISYYRADTLISSDGSINLELIKEIVKDALKPY